MDCSIIRRLVLVTAAFGTTAIGSSGLGGAIGCSSSDSEEPVAEEKKSEAPATPEAQPTKNEVTFPDAGAAPDEESTDASANACANEKSKEACSSCCVATHSAGQKVQIGALLTCACEPERCKTACTDTACASPVAAPSTGSDCEVCLHSSMKPDGGCMESVQTACMNDADCKALAACQSACGGSQ
jgi:hypothetical protein